MKKMICVVAGLALVVPSIVAAAAPAASTKEQAAKVLSVKASALTPRRAPIKGENMASSSAALIAVVVAGVVGGVVVATSSGSDSR